MRPFLFMYSSSYMISHALHFASRNKKKCPAATDGDSSLSDLDTKEMAYEAESDKPHATGNKNHRLWVRIPGNAEMCLEPAPSHLNTDEANQDTVECRSVVGACDTPSSGYIMVDACERLCQRLSPKHLLHGSSSSGSCSDSYKGPKCHPEVCFLKTFPMKRYAGCRVKGKEHSRFWGGCDAKKA